MIIIAIIMAVAVPAYLGSKEKAIATHAKEDARNAADVIDSCVAGGTEGTYMVGGQHCGSKVAILEPAFNGIFTQGASMAPGDVWVPPIPIMAIIGVFTGQSCIPEECMVVAAVTTDSEGGSLASVFLGTESSLFMVFKNSNGRHQLCYVPDPVKKQRMCPLPPDIPIPFNSAAWGRW